MNKQIGIWIDTKKAKIVVIDGNQRNLKIVDSDIETRERVDGESKQFGRFGDQYHDQERANSQKLKNQTKVFFNTILKELNDCESIVVFGPAGMKNEFEKEIKNNYQLSPKLREVITTDSMTDNQTSAWVVNYFNNLN